MRPEKKVIASVQKYTKIDKNLRIVLGNGSAELRKCLSSFLKALKS